MFEPSANIRRSNRGERILQGGSQGARRPGLERAEKRLEVRNALFTRVKVWPVSWQVLHAGAGCFEQAYGPRTIMELHSIQTHDIALRQHRREQRLNLEGKALTVDRPLNSQRGYNP